VEIWLRLWNLTRIFRNISKFSKRHQLKAKHLMERASLSISCEMNDQRSIDSINMHYWEWQKINNIINQNLNLYGFRSTIYQWCPTVKVCCLRILFSGFIFLKQRKLSKENHLRIDLSYSGSICW